tara:strand:+ start:791 stop:1033 length:243 start_codon:yes stop_codon:yes gene_type:complete
MKTTGIDLSQFHTDTKGELKKSVKQSKLGRKPKKENEKRSEKVGTNLTPKEKNDWITALDGRSESKVLRDLIKKYTESKK